MSIIAKIKAEAAVLEAEFEKYFSKQSLHTDILNLKFAVASHIGNVAKHVEEYEAAVVAKAKIDLGSIAHEAEEVVVRSKADLEAAGQKTLALGEHEVSAVEADVKSDVVEKGVADVEHAATEAKTEAEHVASDVVADVEHVAAEAEAEVKKL